MKYNALNQLMEAIMPDGSALHYSYDKGGLLNKLSKQETEFITNITYNAKGQRENIYYGNNTKTRYDYHPENFRLIRLLTSRNTGQNILQDLNYEYDAEGNITAITDGAQETIFHDNQMIEARSTYSYDALYRLISATGRELSAIATPSHKEYPYTEQIPGNAIRNYIHQYTYDELGNMISNAWRTNHYAQSNNRLLIMKFSIEYTGFAEKRVLTYDQEESSFDVDPSVSEIDFDITINTLNLTVVDSKVVQLWGFCGLNKEMEAKYIVPKSQKGILRVLDELTPGLSYRVNKEEYPVFVNIYTGWVCIGEPEKIGNAVEFINNCIAVIDNNGKFVSLWLKPQELPDILN